MFLRLSSKRHHNNSTDIMRKVSMDMVRFMLLLFISNDMGREVSNDMVNRGLK